MKLSLVVLTPGPNQGKVLEIKLSQFVVGRDPQCHLRPASPMISKRHCAILQREGKAFVRDFDSTNGTFVNNQQIKGEVELHNGDQLKLGPLMFTVLIEASTPVNRPTPPPPTKPATKTMPAAKASTPVPATNKPAAKPAAKSQAVPQTAAPAEPAASATVESEAPDPAAEADAPHEAPPTEESASGGDDDDIAAMLLSLHDDTPGGSPGSPPEVPEGSTVHELPVPPDVAAEMAKNKAKETPKTVAPGNTSLAAKSILEKYMKRPRS